MSFEELIKDVSESYAPSQATYRISFSYNRNSLALSKMGNPIIVRSSKLTKELYNSLNEQRGPDGKHKLTINNLSYKIMVVFEEEILSFLRAKLKSANPRLTGIYKWYKQELQATMNRNTEFADDITELYKYLFDRTDTLTDVDVQNGLGLLKLIYNKHRRY
jgi:hypothetical protein